MKYSIYDLQFEQCKSGFVGFDSKENLKTNFRQYLINRMDEDELSKVDNDFDSLIDHLEYRIICSVDDNDTFYVLE